MMFLDMRVPLNISCTYLNLRISCRTIADYHELHLSHIFQCTPSTILAFCSITFSSLELSISLKAITLTNHFLAVKHGMSTALECLTVLLNTFSAIVDLFRTKPPLLRGLL